MSSRFVCNGAISSGKFLKCAADLNIHLNVAEFKKSRDTEDEDVESNNTKNEANKVVFTVEAIEALRLGHAKFLTLIASEMNKLLSNDTNRKRTKLNDGSPSQSSDDKIRSISRKLVESSMENLRLIQNLDRCKENRNFWNQKDSVTVQIEETSEIQNAQGKDDSGNVDHNKVTEISNELAEPMLQPSHKKRREKLKRKKMKNAFKNRMQTEALLAEQERLLAQSATNAMQNLQNKS